MIDFIAGDEHEVTALLASEKRGRPLGSPEVDWFEAKNQLARGDAVMPIFAIGMGPREEQWRHRQDQD